MIPPHHTYVEVFGGAAHLLFAKHPSPIEVYNDIDGRLVNFYRVLQDPEKCLQLLHKLSLTLYSRQMFREAQSKLDSGDEVERAVNFFIVVRQSISASLTRWGYSMAGKSKSSLTYMSAIDMLPLFHIRLRHVQVENDDFEKVIRRYDTPETFFFCDPPYILSTLKNRPPFITMSDDDHKRFVELLLQIEGKVLLTIYDHPLYQPLSKNGWKKKKVKRLLTATNPRKALGGKRIHQVETIYWNYDLPKI